jgi:hypothetical protein
MERSKIIAGGESEFNYDIRTFVNITVYSQYNNNMIIKFLIVWGADVYVQVEPLLITNHICSKFRM